MYIDVLVELKAKALDKTFTYSVPSNLEDKIDVGKRVYVPFGKQKLEGFILSFNNSDSFDYDVKDIIDVIDDDVIINDEMMSLGRYISRKTLCTLISAYQTMLPSALKAKHGFVVRKKYETYLTLVDSNFFIKSDKQREVYNKLCESEFVLKKDCVSISSYVVKSFLDKGYIKEVKREVYRNNSSFVKEDCCITLNDEQDYAVSSVINSDGFVPYLLHGVTGSGKTEVYMHIISYYLNIGKSAIVLVPEISLTPQTVLNFRKRFGNDIAILHSGLSDGERYDFYRKILKGEVSIVIGARSAIFAPLKNIGVIIIDEEHSSTYKQDNTPKYNAIDVAIYRCRFHNCPLVLGSATPSIESFTRATNGIYKLLCLKNRVNNNLPNVKLVDMKDEFRKGNKIFSSDLSLAINDRLCKGEQIILLLNRRGFSTITTCSHCGFVHKCPNCDIPLVYHKSSNTYRCHYCGYGSSIIVSCPICGNNDLNNFGMGTEKLAELVSSNFVGANVVRMDVDTTTRKGAHERILNDFKNLKYNVLIGTQMIAKGLDFPLVTLVGVINGDSSLNIPDFRSGERTFQLLSQVAGRAGRASLPGDVIIQGFNIDHYSIVCASRHDYIGFYDEEMRIRRLLGYPPFYNLCSIKIKCHDEDNGLLEGKRIVSYLKGNLDASNIILGPSITNKINNYFNVSIVVKYKRTGELINKLMFINNKYIDRKDIFVDIDLNPYKI
ncbi:MAG: primosomal protein N' [Bacilli bacterium]|nr:primosomal protein N' [Bacilli bacterium]